MKSKDNYKVIGVMSGTSLDGMDIAFCKFSLRKKWKFEILAATTVPYSPEWRAALAGAHLLSGEKLLTLHAAYGKLIGENCAIFIKRKKLKNIRAICSHGHTIFHQPNKQLTFQLGNGNAIQAVTRLPVIFDFRSLDVALNGEGAPLVPAGDRYLFGGYDVCLNLGGIANVSMEKKGRRIAYDVCFANMGLNYLAAKAGKALDEDGRMASKGEVNNDLLFGLKAIYDRDRKTKPSIGRERFENEVKPLLDTNAIPLNDLLRTFCESIADEIAACIPGGRSVILATGGGALNPFLMDVLRQKIKKGTVVLPPGEIIEFKEAMIFGFLGVLRMRGEVNVLKSVTRAKRDSCGGVLI